MSWPLEECVKRRADRLPTAPDRSGVCRYRRRLPVVAGLRLRSGSALASRQQRTGRHGRKVRCLKVAPSPSNSSVSRWNGCLACATTCKCWRRQRGPAARRPSPRDRRSARGNEQDPRGDRGAAVSETELLRLVEETKKFVAEAHKLEAERRKLDCERAWFPWLRLLTLS